MIARLQGLERRPHQHAARPIPDAATCCAINCFTCAGSHLVGFAELL
jgi:hypothetical protein